MVVMSALVASTCSVLRRILLSILPKSSVFFHLRGCVRARIPRGRHRHGWPRRLFLAVRCASRARAAERDTRA